MNGDALQRATLTELASLRTNADDLAQLIETAGVREVAGLLVLAASMNELLADTADRLQDLAANAEVAPVPAMDIVEAQPEDDLRNGQHDVEHDGHRDGLPTNGHAFRPRRRF